MTEFTSLADMISQKPTTQPEPGKPDPRFIMFSKTSDAVDWYSTLEAAEIEYIHRLDRTLTRLIKGDRIVVDKVVKPENRELFYRSLSLIMCVCPKFHSDLSFNDDFTIIKKNL